MAKFDDEIGNGLAPRLYPDLPPNLLFSSILLLHQFTAFPTDEHSSTKCIGIDQFPAMKMRLGTAKIPKAALQSTLELMRLVHEQLGHFIFAVLPERSGYSGVGDLSNGMLHSRGFRPVSKVQRALEWRFLGSLARLTSRVRRSVVRDGPRRTIFSDLREHVGDRVEARISRQPVSIALRSIVSQAKLGGDRSTLTT